MPALATTLVESGIDGIITDDPRIIAPALERHVKRAPRHAFARRSPAWPRASSPRPSSRTRRRRRRPRPTTTTTTTDDDRTTTTRRRRQVDRPHGVTIGGVQVGGLRRRRRGRSRRAGVREPLVLRFDARRRSASRRACSASASRPTPPSRARSTVAPNTALALRAAVTTRSSSGRSSTSSPKRFDRKPVDVAAVPPQLQAAVVTQAVDRPRDRPVERASARSPTSSARDTRAPITLKAS